MIIFSIKLYKMLYINVYVYFNKLLFLLM